MTPKAQATKEKQTGLHQNGKFWYIKGCHEHKNEPTDRMGENICKSHIQWRVNTQNIERIPKTQQQKPINLIQKLSKDFLKRHFSKEDK